MDHPSNSKKVDVDPTNTALPIILAPFKKGEAFRHLWLGDTGQGKTIANRILVDTVINRRLVDIVLSIDDKNPKQPQYAGTFRANTNHLRQDMPKSKEESRHIVFRGVALRRDLSDQVTIGEVAAMGWDVIRTTNASILINIDELSDATNGHQSWDDDLTAQIYRKGRGVGLSVSATTQLPQLLPREAFGLSETIGIFRMDGREANYLVKYRILTPDLEAIVTHLEVGQWILYRKGGGGWDGKIYKFRMPKGMK